jgi:RNA polymerase sigma-70 factor (ECF subfamily)
MQRMGYGDRLALAQLIGLYGRGVRSYCARVLDQAGDAEDAAQEVFLRLWSRARSYDPGKASVATWTYRIALRLCIDWNRRARVRWFFGMSRAEMPEVEDPNPDALRVLSARQDLAKVRRVVADLPDRQRQALLLQVVAGMETAEIAGVMGSGSGAVEQLLARARASLRARAGLELK